MQGYLHSRARRRHQMSKIKYEIFDGNAEVTSFVCENDNKLEFVFPASCEGFLSIDGVVVRVSSGIGEFDIRYVSDGEFTPYLVMPHGRIALPKIKKSGRRISLCECSSEYIRGISLREYLLAERVKALEVEIERLKRCIYGTKIL